MKFKNTCNYITRGVFATVMLTSWQLFFGGLAMVVLNIYPYLKNTNLTDIKPDTRPMMYNSRPLQS